MRAFITGVGSGFGLSLSRAMLAAGHEVVGTDRDLAGVADRLGNPAGLELRTLQLVDPISIAAATRDVGPIDVLVNNAGYAVFGSQAEGDLDGFARMLEANVVGTARVTAALLPTLRQRAGTVVQLSSVAGRMVFAESGFYAATKHAVEAMSEALYLENASFGLRVVVVEPGSYDTGFLARAQAESPPRADGSPYASLYELWDARKVSVLEPPQPPREVADAILGALTHGPAYQRVVVGADARRILGLRDRLSPDAWVRLMGERHGGPPAGAPFASPAQVRSTPTHELFATWPESVAAAVAGHLDHWKAQTGGADALKLLLQSAPQTSED